MKEQVFQFSTGRMLFIGPCMPIKLKINKYIFGCFEKHALASSISTSYQCKRWQNPPVMRLHLVFNSRKHLITAVCVCSAQSDDCVEADTKPESQADISFGALLHFFMAFSLCGDPDQQCITLSPDITSLHLEGEKCGLCQEALGKIPHPIWTESNLKKISIVSNCLKTAGRSFSRPWTKTNSLFGHLSHWPVNSVGVAWKYLLKCFLCTFPLINWIQFYRWCMKTDRIV